MPNHHKLEKRKKQAAMPDMRAITFSPRSKHGWSKETARYSGVGFSVRPQTDRVLDNGWVNVVESQLPL